MPVTSLLLIGLHTIWHEDLHVMQLINIKLPEIGARFYFLMDANQITYTCSCAAIPCGIRKDGTACRVRVMCRGTPFTELATRHTPQEPHHVVTGSMPDYFVGYIDVLLFSPPNRHSAIAQYSEASVYELNPFPDAVRKQKCS
jgi:hypothetical protein